MHELSATQGILNVSLRHAEAANATRIVAIDVVIGQLSSFVDDAVQMYWDIISEGTIACGATLHFRRIPAQIQCQQCRNVYPLNTPDFICPTCGGVCGEVINGDQFYVESIDVA